MENSATAMATIQQTGKTGKFLTFELDTGIYGIEILKVQEIIGIMKVTSVPRTPSYVRGVINLRGKVIPVLDLRLKFGMPHTEDSDKTCVIVVRITVNQTVLVMGIIVDAVSEVLNITAEQSVPAPSFGPTSTPASSLGWEK